MRRALYLKFLLAYLLFGLLGFILTATLGSHLVENHLLDITSSNLYHMATNIARNSTVKYINDTNAASIKREFSAISSFQGSEIWIMNYQEEIILNSSQEEPLSAPVPVPGFDPTAWGASYYRTGNFYGYFSQEQLSVIAPITNNMNIKGYIAIHYPLSKLRAEREKILSSVYLMCALFLLLSLLILFVLDWTIYRPLKKITAGVNEFSSGNLSYNIPVDTEDEMGYLAAALNDMSDQLNQSGEYQRNFISNVSHDFRSPLTSIKGYVEAIEDGTIPPEMQGKYLKIVSFEAERLEKLTSSLLTLNDLDMKNRMLKMTVFDINAVIKTTAASFEETCRQKKISIELILYGEKLRAKADMEQIQRVLYNLLDNAIKFSKNHSSIVVETTEKNGKIFVSVKDSGVGISKEHLPKIWNRFYKSDSSRGRDRKGTGLGLSIVKEIIDAHGQNINVVSTEDVGTEFIFTLEKQS